MNLVKEYLENNSSITNKDAEKLGSNRRVLAELVKEGKLERIRPGLYQKKGDIVDDFALISANSKRIIFSHHTSLYLHDLSDRTPNVFDITVPQGYNAGHIKKRYERIQVHYVKKELHEIGLIKLDSPLGNSILSYDMERTICDIIIDRKNIDKQIFVDGITRYFKSSNKNLINLIKYSRYFGIEEEVRKYMEVLAWQTLKVLRER